MSTDRSVPIRRTFVASIAAVLLLGVALPAAAESTTATVEITGGSLSISAPADAGSLGTTANTVEGTTISGPLGEVQSTTPAAPQPAPARSPA